MHTLLTVPNCLVGVGGVLLAYLSSSKLISCLVAAFSLSKWLISDGPTYKDSIPKKLTVDVRTLGFVADNAFFECAIIDLTFILETNWICNSFK